MKMKYLNKYFLKNVSNIENCFNNIVSRIIAIIITTNTSEFSGIKLFEKATNKLTLKTS